MALSVYGLNVPESDLIAQLRFDPTKRAGNIWGDPYAGFVGSIDGEMGVTGYGVYWDPIAEVGNKYLPTKAVRFDSPADLAAEIAAGHPVVAWGYNGAGKHLSWNTPDGKQIDAINGEHARTIGGFDGDVNNPTRFIVYDPIYGKLSWTAEELFKNWAPFDNMGVVVYPKDEDSALLDKILTPQ
jgi:YD repeat-containing protein